MRIFVLATVFLLMNAGPLTAAESTQTLRSGRLLFGWATLSITPEKPVAIAGQYYTRISDQVNDPLFATALAIETRDDAGVVDQAVSSPVTWRSFAETFSKKCAAGSGRDFRISTYKRSLSQRHTPIRHRR